MNIDTEVKKAFEQIQRYAIENIPPNYEQITTGTLKSGDLVWNTDKSNFVKASAKDALIIKHYFCVIRKIKS